MKHPHLRVLPFSHFLKAHSLVLLNSHPERLEGVTHHDLNYLSLMDVSDCPCSGMPDYLSAWEKCLGNFLTLFCGPGDRIEGLRHAKQVLTYLYSLDKVSPHNLTDVKSLCSPCRPQTIDHHASASRRAAITRLFEFLIRSLIFLLLSYYLFNIMGISPLRYT